MVADSVVVVDRSFVAVLSAAGGRGRRWVWSHSQSRSCGVLTKVMTELKIHRVVYTRDDDARIFF